LLNEAVYRLKFEELFLLQLKLLKNKLLHTQKFKGNVFDKVGHYFNEFYHNKLPFTLDRSAETGAERDTAGYPAGCADEPPVAGRCR
jgi:RecG-like helicase